ncbi:hypothetical protein SKAU_G00259180 [Synaphobranchus kaupii]|uniref:Uncharacterized protein n=1 Tax=Synaphobranchus kaupii TaxID=118154 RepID=A0A9Q1F4C6_SYNKA|nr:hypothetical protein SKAU_G00259180 [Synaphobranchus kaupii]
MKLDRGHDGTRGAAGCRKDVIGGPFLPNWRLANQRADQKYRNRTQAGGTLSGAPLPVLVFWAFGGEAGSGGPLRGGEGSHVSFSTSPSCRLQAPVMSALRVTEMTAA